MKKSALCIKSDSNFKFFFIQPYEVAEWWPLVKELAAEAMTTMRGKYDADDLFSCACKNQVQFWVGIEDGSLDVKLFGVTQLNDFPSTRICQVICVTGKEKHLWENLMGEVEIWAKLNRCTDMELVARQGWRRVMKKYGYEHTHEVLNKSLMED